MEKRIPRESRGFCAGWTDQLRRCSLLSCRCRGGSGPTCLRLRAVPRRACGRRVALLQCCSCSLGPSLPSRVHNFVFTVLNFVFLPKFDFHIFEFQTEIMYFPDQNSFPGVVRKRKISPKFGEIPPKLWTLLPSRLISNLIPSRREQKIRSGLLSVNDRESWAGLSWTERRQLGQPNGMAPCILLIAPVLFSIYFN